MPKILLFTGKGMGIKTIKQLALGIASHSSLATKLLFSQNRAGAEKSLVQLHSPWYVST